MTKKEKLKFKNGALKDILEVSKLVEEARDDFLKDRSNIKAALKYERTYGVLMGLITTLYKYEFISEEIYDTYCNMYQD